MSYILATARGWLRDLPVAMSAYRRLPEAIRMGLSSTFARRMVADLRFPPLPDPRGDRPPSRTTSRNVDDRADGAGVGVNLFAYFQGRFGLAEAARNYADALVGADYPVALCDVDLDLPHDFGEDRLLAHCADTAPFPVSIIFVNPDYFDEAVAHIGSDRFEGTYLIGCWFWELERVPDAWLAAVARVDAVMVASEFVASAFRRITTKPVFIVPLPLTHRHDSGLVRADFALRDNSFLFLASFDFNSWIERKNPAATIAAFQKAFPGGENVQLVLKTSNGERHPEALAQLLVTAGGDSRILIRDGAIAGAHLAALQRCCDAYVSLHRAEGFGLGLAECMSIGKPVIATAWSGNLEFMTSENSCLVDYRLVPVPDDHYLHTKGQRWAQPDIAQAATFMRTLYYDRSVARTLGERAQRDVAGLLSGSRAAKTMIDWLDARDRASAGALNR
ncbi:glycosyltransferase family 4 protein [Lysobacter sp. HA18]